MDKRYAYDEEMQKWYVWENGKRIETDEPVMPKPDKVNCYAREKHLHDSINQWIAVEARARHLGVYGHCEHCEDGRFYTEPKAHLRLQLWVLHPRKGASRGVEITNINEDEVAQVVEYLKSAAARNAERFSNLGMAK